MDNLDMDTGIIPIRHSSLPGQVKLPKRYEKACKDSTLNGRNRKISHAHAPTQKEGLGDRLDDLMQAMMWVKQELIMLRQHDILLKRQFFDIQDTIHSLQKPQSSESLSSPSVTRKVRFRDSDDYFLENFIVRPSSSVTLLNGVDESEEEEETETFRPRTCSMRTSRDLAALARRRGSKELV